MLRRDPAVEVAGLLTTINDAANRVAMHAVRDALLDRQAGAVGLPVVKVRIPSPCSNADYEAAMDEACATPGGGASRPWRSAISFLRTSGDIVRRNWPRPV